MTSSGSTKTGISEETLQIIKRLFKDAKVGSFKQIGQLLEDSGSAPSSGFARGAVAAANSKTISKVAVYVPVFSPDNKQFDEFRKVVIDLFCAEGPKAKLKKATMSEAANTMSQLQRDVSPFKYSKVLQELRVGQCSGWVLRNADVNPFKPTSS